MEEESKEVEGEAEEGWRRCKEGEGGGRKGGGGGDEEDKEEKQSL